jgi:putative inorganic carbon (HCO3(-)) transporter
LFGVILGLSVLIICMTNPEIAFYILIAYGFFASFISSYLFRGQMPIGVIFDGLVLATMIGLVIKRTDFRQSLGQFFKIPLVVFIFLTLFYNAVQIFNPNAASTGSVAFLAFRKFLGYVFILFVAYTLFDSYEKIKRYIIVLFVVATISALYGCAQEWHGLFNFEMEQILADPHAIGLLFANGEFRKFSTMSDPSSFGILMAICTVFFLILALNQRNLFRKTVLITGSIFMILGMAYSGTRTAYATVVGGFAFFVLLNFHKKSIRIFGFVTGILLLIVIYGPFYGNKTINRFRTTFVGAKDESYKVRVLSRQFIQPYIRSHPIGGGLGTTGFAGAADHPGHFLGNFQPDSSYVKRAAETGWIGLGIICVLYFFTLKIGITRYFRARDERIKILTTACVTSLFAFYIAEFAQVAVGGISDVVVYYPLLAMILKLKHYDKEPETKLPA